MNEPRRFLSLRLAWRDGRAQPRRWLLAAGSVVVGIAALVAVRSFGMDIAAAVAAESKALLGADLEIHARQPFGVDARALFAEIGGERVQEVSLGSMAYFPDSGRSRLVRVRAVEPGYPFYGDVETVPAGALERLHGGPHALVDRALLLQLGAEVGDVVRIGELQLTIIGELVRFPGEVPTASLVGPRVLMPLDLLDSTGLIQPGSRVRYAALFRLPMTVEEVDELVGELRERLRELRLEAESVAYRRRVVGRAMEDLDVFLALTAMTALLLGAVGTASAAAIHARRHRRTVALLRCIGARGRLPLTALGIQAVGMAVTGALVGGAVGVGVQRTLPGILGSFLPFEVQVALHPVALLEAMVVGLVTVTAFALVPLAPLRRVRPLTALRADVTPSGPVLREIAPPLMGLGTLLLLMAWRQTGDGGVAAGLVVGFVGVLASLAAIAYGLRSGARRLLRAGWRWEWRQGVANLYRPRNQTLVMMLGLGAAVFLVATLVLVSRGILGSLQAVDVAGGADLVLFDVQPDQLATVRDELRAREIPVLEEVPVVPMRLARHRGRPVAEVRDEEISAWSLRREYNSTYRERLTDAEELLQGTWVGRFEEGMGERVPVSLEEDIARRLEVGVGDRLEFDVQGVPVPVVVASLRRVDWQQVRPNFFVVFPTGVLEQAPQQMVVVARAGEPDRSAAAQKAVVEALPNVSVVDLALVLRTVDDVLGQIRSALRFLAGFVVLAGLAVLVAATLESRAERQREGVLLRTLGASRGQIGRIGLAEYLVLGAIAGTSGLLLALASAWIVLRQVFDAGLDPAPAALLGILAATLALTGALGIWNGRAMARRPVLEQLRGG